MAAPSGKAVVRAAQEYLHRFDHGMIGNGHPQRLLAARQLRLTRLMECMSLRVKDVNFGRLKITILHVLNRGGQGVLSPIDKIK